MCGKSRMRSIFLVSLLQLEGFSDCEQTVSAYTDEIGPYLRSIHCFILRCCLYVKRYSASILRWSQACRGEIKRPASSRCARAARGMRRQRTTITTMRSCIRITSYLNYRNPAAMPKRPRRSGINYIELVLIDLEKRVF